jgi:hypothetical protein
MLLVSVPVVLCSSCLPLEALLCKSHAPAFLLECRLQPAHLLLDPPRVVFARQPLLFGLAREFVELCLLLQESAVRLVELHLQLSLSLASLLALVPRNL